MRPGGAGEAGGGTGFGFRGFFVAIPRRGVRFQGFKETGRDGGDPGDCRLESRFVGFRRPGEAGDLADELEGCGVDLFGRGRGIEIEQRPDAAAHLLSLPEFPNHGLPTVRMLD